ncbi:MAG: prolipoprotein diacylglyceryl transferase [Candidatus Saganbacteria bacterium]|nr:prolipoprotein diacylglyceryl transferase [Candidatus Saganbacteria bacterium]
MHPIILQLGPLSVYSWGLMVATAFAVGIGLAILNGKREGITADHIMDLAMYVVIFSVIGARIFYIVQFWDDFKGNIAAMFAVWEGGMVFYGGLIFAAATVYFVARKRGLNVLQILDVISPSVAIGYSIGRIGCFLRGCCFGLQCDLPWAVHFPDATGFVHPTQIYSSIAGLLMFIVLSRVFSRKKYNGQVFIWGLSLYSIYRFIIEFFRFCPDHYFGLTASQIISVALLIFALVLRPFLLKRE